MSKTNKAGGGVAMNDDLRREIAEALLGGEDAGRLAQKIASRGIGHALAVSEIERALKSPYFVAAERLRQRLGKRDWFLANYAKLAPPASGDVPRVHTLDAETFFSAFYVAHRPVVLTGLVDHWPAMTRWSLDDFEARVGGAEVRVQWERNADKDYERNSDAHGAVRPFREIIERLRASETTPTNDFYVTANNHTHNRDALAPLYGDAGPIAGYLAEPGGAGGFLWLGPKGTVTPWHHDLTNNLLLQIVGRKRVRLVSSHHSPLMRNSRHCFSDWGGEALEPGPGDGTRPPVMVADIGPGDALFLPVGWWHHVEGLDVTIGMSFTNFARDNDFWSHYASYGTV